MNLVLKTFVYCAVMVGVVLFYGEDIIRFVNNQGQLKRGTESRELLAPTSSVSIANLTRSFEIPRMEDGHYWVNVSINNNPVRFIVDTGASFITLSHEDAAKLNIYLSETDYNVPVRTAAGNSSMAEINIDVVTIGAIEIYDVKALIARQGMLSVSLLGMNYLNRLDRFEFRERTLILEQ